MVRVRVQVTGPADAFTDVAVASLLLRELPDEWDEVVRVFVPAPTIGFTRRDLRAPGIAQAVQVAHDHGFTPVVRAPGGRVAAYGPGSVIVDHVTRTRVGFDTGEPFRRNARAHLRLLRSLGVDAHIGELEGEYCPGEYSINVGGRFKVVGSAQRVTLRASLFSTVFQVDASPSLHSVLAGVSAALAYPFAPSTVGGVSDVLAIDVDEFLDAVVDDYEQRLGLVGHHVPARIADLLSDLPARDGDAFDAETWARARLSSSGP